VEAGHARTIPQRRIGGDKKRKRVETPKCADGLGDGTHAHVGKNNDNYIVNKSDSHFHPRRGNGGGTRGHRAFTENGHSPP